MCQFGFRKWKSHVTERPFEDRSEVVKELYSDLKVIKPHTSPGIGYCVCVVCEVCVISEHIGLLSMTSVSLVELFCLLLIISPACFPSVRSIYLMWKCRVCLPLWMVGFSGIPAGWRNYVRHHRWYTIRYDSLWLHQTNCLIQMNTSE